MRIVLAVALCFILGACATFGGGGPDPYGIYDVVSVNGVDWSATDDMSGWYELRADGTSTVTMEVADMPDAEPANANFTLGEMKDGCFPFSGTGEDGSLWKGTICGDVFTIEGPQTSVVMHRRK